MGQYGIGQGIKRIEDVRLLRGAGRYLDDVNVPGQAHAVILRSQHAHARLRGVDTKAALSAPGVLAVFTGADVQGRARVAAQNCGPRSPLPRPD